MRWLFLSLAISLPIFAGSQFSAAAFYWDATHVSVVSGAAPEQMPPDAKRLAEPKGRPPWGNLFSLPGMHASGGVNTGDALDINLTGNFWVRATVTRFVYDKTLYQPHVLAIAAIDEADRDRYAAAVGAKLSVFLAEPAAPQRVSGEGPLRNPVTPIDLPAADRAALEAYLNKIMIAKLREAITKDHTTPTERMSLLLAGKAKLSVEINRVDLGEALGVRQQISGTWTIGGQSVFSIQGWMRAARQHEKPLIVGGALNTKPVLRGFLVERIDGFPEDKAPIVDATGDWGEESLDDFEIENVFAGGRLLRHISGYERSDIYLEQLTAGGGRFERTLYGL